MTVRPLFRGASADPLMQAITSSVTLRFDLSAERLAARIGQFAEAAGVAATDYAMCANLDDLYLASACAAGDAAAWEECETRHFGFVRSFAHRTLPDVDARDLADQVIADLWQKRKIDRYSGRSSLRTWLGAVVAHAAHNVRRSAASTLPLGSSGMTHAVSPPENSLEELEAERALGRLVGRALLMLPPEEKLLLHLYYEQGLTLDDMEPVMRCSKATLSRRLKAVRATLKKVVDDLACQRLGSSLDTLRDGVHLERLELNLSALLRPEGSMKEQGPGRV